jgi:long-subunit fatty acid transport protein
MIRRVYLTLFVGVILSASAVVQAQYPIDALRYSFSNLGPGSRAMSMGGAYVGVADDFYATFWNPAGLGQIRRYELVGGFDNINVNNNATYLNSAQDYSNNVTNLGSIGITIPIETVQGSLTFAIGYNRPQDFTGAVSTRGFNPVSSVASSMYIDPSSIDGDMAYRLYLEDTLGNVRIGGNVNQVATILEEGRLGSWDFAGAIEAAKDLFFGASLDLYTGTYSYSRDIDESDTQNRYRNYQEGIHSGWQGLNLVSTLDQDISGVGAKLGILYRVRDIARIGLTMKTPSLLSVQESWTDRGTSYFDTGTETDRVDGKTEYDIVTPFQFSGGVSVTLNYLLLTASAELTDWSQMKFENTQDQNAEIDANRRIKELFRPTVNLRGGGELLVPGTELRLRAGYAILPSPYKDDPTSYARQLFTCGIGYTIDNTVTLDATYIRGWNENYEYLYGGYSSGTRIDDTITSNNVMLTLLYRF